ncbi:hypothetical protein D3C84_380410 [compost metagenome]
MQHDELPNWHYVLDGKTPVQATLLEWAAFYQTADRHVGNTKIGRIWISTVFLGIDHGYDPRQPPVLFETMVFGGGELHETMIRYATWAEAEAGHNDMVEVVQAMVDRLQRYEALRMHDRYLRFPKPKRAPAWRPSSIL